MRENRMKRGSGLGGGLERKKNRLKDKKERERRERYIMSMGSGICQDTGVITRNVRLNSGRIHAEERMDG